LLDVRCNRDHGEHQLLGCWGAVPFTLGLGERLEAAIKKGARTKIPLRALTRHVPAHLVVSHDGQQAAGRMTICSRSARRTMSSGSTCAAKLEFSVRINITKQRMNNFENGYPLSIDVANDLSPANSSKNG
jgi:hypothetical protein